MAFLLEQRENLAEGLRRIVMEEISLALKYLELGGKDREKDIHEARKSFKKIRAVFKLIRGELSVIKYRRENSCFRDLGKKLSAVRDLAVRLETLEKIRKTARRNRLVLNMDPLLIETRRIYFIARRRIQPGHPSLIQSREILFRAQRRVRRITLTNDQFSALYPGLSMVYRRGRDQMVFLWFYPTDEGFHEWRKQVKNLWYHVRILQNIWPAVMDGLNKSLHDLSEYLGQEHDYTELLKFVDSHAKLFKETQNWRDTVSLIHRKKIFLRNRSLSIARKIYLEDPDLFCQRLQGYWETW